MVKPLSFFDHETLLQSERKFKAIFTTSLDSIIITNDQLQIRDANPAACVLFNTRKEVLLKKKLPSLFTGEHKAEVLSMWNKLKQAGTYKGELEIEPGDGSLRTIEYNAISDFLPHRNLFVIRDVTDRRIEEKRRDHFVAVASHELKSPLASVKALVALLRRKPAQISPERSGEYLDRIEEKIDTFTRLINDLLDITRIRQGKLEFTYDYFSYGKFIREIIHDIQIGAVNHKITISNRCRSDIVADRTRISQVIRNLLRNAIRYSPHGSTIRISSYEEAGRIITCIADKGPGIPVKDRKRIFDLYYRGEQNGAKTTSGLGLGLYISAEIIKQHKGKIWVEGNKGKGAVFCFTIPINPKISENNRTIF